MKIALTALVFWTAITLAATPPRAVISAAKLCERQLAGPSGRYLSAYERYQERSGRAFWVWQLRNLVRHAGDVQAQQALLHTYFKDQPNLPYAFVEKAIRKIFESRAERASALLGWMDLHPTNVEDFIAGAKWMRQLTGRRPFYIIGSRRLLMPEIVKAFVERNAYHLTQSDLERLAKADPDFAPMIYVSLVGSLAAQRQDGRVIASYYDELGPELYSSTLLSLLEQKPQYFKDPEAFTRLAARALEPSHLLQIYLEENSSLLTKSQLRRMKLAAGLAPAQESVVVDLAQRRDAAAKETLDFHALALLASAPGATFDTFLTESVIHSIQKLALASQANLLLESTIGTRDEKEARVLQEIFRPALRSEPPPIFTTAELLAKIQNPAIQKEMLDAYTSALTKTPAERENLEAKVIAAMPQGN